jgi:O-succinylbenzoic acid--CoA ligase
MDDPRPTTWLTAAVAADPNAPALICDGVEVSYRDLNDLVDRTAASLTRLVNLGPGGTLGVAVTNRPVPAIATMWASWRLGAVVMPLDPRLPELQEGAARMQDAYRLAAVVTEVEPAAVPWRGEVTPAPDDVHSLILTSGTTSGRKAALLTNRNVASAVVASQHRIGNGPEDRWLLCLPMFHVGGLSILWRSAAAGGSVIVHSSFNALAAATALRSGDVTIASFVPTMLQRVLDVDPGPYGNVKAVLVGGAAVSPALVERGLDAGLPVLATYGMTEATSQIATVVPGEERGSLGTVGRPLEGMQVDIDTDGTITVDGPAVSPGYYGEPPRSGALRTNDLGTLDAAGRLIVHGRRDDVIVTGGEKVHPTEVERVLKLHPAVSDSAVYGLPDPEWGAVVAATVVLSGSATIDELVEHCRALLVPFQVPKLWRIDAEAPQGSTGKPDRAAARLAHLEERS